jgi:uncharacterized protein YceK
MKQILAVLAVVVLAAASGCSTMQTSSAPAKSDGVVASAKGASALQCTAGWHACTCEKGEKCCSFQKDCECSSGGQPTCH